MTSVSVCAPLEQLHSAFLNVILPKVEAHGAVTFRHIRCSDTKADWITEAIAIAWKSFRRLAERGKDGTAFPAVIADLAVRHVKAGRRLAGQERAKDVMSFVAQRRRGFRVEPLPSLCTCHETLYSTPHGQRLQDVYEERLRDDSCTPILDQVCFRVDFREWLATLTYRDKRVIEDLAAGHRTMDVARKYGLSPGRISQLRVQFRRDWLRFIGELPLEAPLRDAA